MSYEEAPGTKGYHSVDGPTSVDLFAPGESNSGTKHGIFSTRWRSRPIDQGTETGTAAVLPDRDYGDIVWDGTQYTQIHGTSFATPQVSGTIALMLSLNPEATVAQLRDGLLHPDSIDPSSTLTSYCVTGGSLNVKKALTRAVSQFADYSTTVIGDQGGTSVADTFLVKQVTVGSSNRVQVWLNGVQQQFWINGAYQSDLPNSAVTKPIALFGLGGADSFTVSGAVNVPLYVSGGNANDSLIGGSGSDTLEGGAGNDTLVGGAGNDVLIGSNGNDSVDYTGSPAAINVSINGVAGGFDGYGDSDALNTSIETIYGSPYNDAIFGSSAANYIDSGVGADSVSAGDGNDTVIGGKGSDSLKGDNGDDVVYSTESPAFNDQMLRGGIGNDILYRDSIDSVIDGTFETVTP